jgi:Uma2 family endonuclease
MMVQTSTDEVPELLDLIEHRRASGLDTFDEWWQGMYRIVAVPPPEHGELVVSLGALLLQRARARALTVAAPVNIGIDKSDARVPDIAVFRADTERTSPAFLRTAELVVEILSPGERAGEKLPFYAEWGVREYLEIDLPHGTVRLLADRDGTWEPVDASAVVELTIDEVTGLLGT